MYTLYIVGIWSTQLTGDTFLCPYLEGGEGDNLEREFSAFGELKKVNEKLRK